MDHFSVVCSETWPLNGSEAGGDIVVIETSLCLLCKSSCSYANQLHLHDKVFHITLVASRATLIIRVKLMLHCPRAHAITFANIYIVRTCNNNFSQSSTARKRWRLVHYPYSLAHENLNAYNNVQKSFKKSSTQHKHCPFHRGKYCINVQNIALYGLCKAPMVLF